MDSSNLENYRQQFSQAPLGRWSTASGTFSSVMDQVWEFYANGTGRYTDYGTFGSVRGETLFEWRTAAERTIALRVTQSTFVDEQVDEDDEGDEDDELTDWLMIRYDFKVVQHDAGSEVAMYAVDQEERGAPYVGFWTSMAPLAYVSPIE